MFFLKKSLPLIPQPSPSTASFSVPSKDKFVKKIFYFCFRHSLTFHLLVSLLLAFSPNTALVKAHNNTSVRILNGRPSAFLLLLVLPLINISIHCFFLETPASLETMILVSLPSLLPLCLSLLS